jgi:hypothetical protein
MFKRFPALLYFPPFSVFSHKIFICFSNIRDFHLQNPILLFFRPVMQQLLKVLFPLLQLHSGNFRENGFLSEKRLSKHQCCCEGNLLVLPDLSCMHPFYFLVKVAGFRTEIQQVSFLYGPPTSFLLLAMPRRQIPRAPVVLFLRHTVYCVTLFVSHTSHVEERSKKLSCLFHTYLMSGFIFC